jgi:hypothetical protein
VAVNHNKVFYYLLPLTRCTHGPKHVVSEWKEVIKKFVTIDGLNNKIIVIPVGINSKPAFEKKIYNHHSTYC